MFEGTVHAIYLGPDPGEPMRSVEEAKAIAGSGLEGDRYFSETGPSGHDKPGRQITLIEAEAVDAVRRESEIDLGYGEPRRNIVTRGVPLNHLVDREFTVGEVRLRGVRLCEPCRHLSELTGKSILQPLLHRAGLRAEIVGGGVIRVGDRVVTQEH